jgi:sulfite reductase alpha subunit-like flavoprotein
MKRMAKDVKTALIDILKKHGSFSNEQALEYIKKLKSAGLFINSHLPNVCDLSILRRMN